MTLYCTELRANVELFSVKILAALKKLRALDMESLLVN